ncbi:unnamed protein product (macronuclear) [Paramecium tetraurelia]|uniref:Uncharacterized protein n=1 Tax=Paramecium tetraurelia TaxID=5888 RepID=A0BP42_PARTE|nr:uncharacterized protein GSPATT00005058001 [Paramecium tetraurelia]CAK60309.1 unnamed protein product [Paramecium tetraurelia]|eukprot:XP_001427707.1 hypothetical protein (macronuclear) [Paramecium tetraurelia strain d4-2]
MSMHSKNNGSQISLYQSPSRIIKDVQEVSKESAAKKVLERRIHELELKLKQQENVIQRYQTQLEESNQETEQIRRQFEDARNDVRQMRLLGEKKDQQIGMLLEENDKVVQLLEVQRNNQGIDNAANTIQQLEQEVRDRFAREKKLSEEIQQYKLKIHSFEDQIKEKNHLIEDLRDKLSHQEKQCSADASLGVLANKRGTEIEILTLQNTELQSQIHNLKSKIQLLLEENSNLQKAIANEKSQENEAKIFSEDRSQEKIKIINDNHQKEISKLMEQHKIEIQVKTDIIDHLKGNLNQYSSKKSQIEELQTVRNSIPKRVAGLSISQSPQGQTNDLQQEYDKLLKKNNQLSEQIFLLQQIKRKDEIINKDKMQQLEKANEKLLETQSINEAKIEELQQKLKQLPTRVREKSIDDLKLRTEQTKLTELDNKVKKLQEKIDQQNLEIKEKNQKINQLQEQVKQAIYEKDNAIQQNKLECAQEVKQVQDQMKMELSNQQKQFNDAQKPYQDQMKTQSIEQQKLKSQAQRYQNEIKTLENRIANLLMENEQIKTQMEKLKVASENLVKDKQGQEMKIQENLREIEVWKEKYVKSVQNCEKQNERVEKEVAKSQGIVIQFKVIQGLKEEINKLNEQLEQIIEQNSTLEEQLSKAQQESRNLRNQLVDGVRRESGSGNKSNGFVKHKA